MKIELRESSVSLLERGLKMAFNINATPEQMEKFLEYTADAFEDAARHAGSQAFQLVDANTREELKEAQTKLANIESILEGRAWEVEERQI